MGINNGDLNEIIKNMKYRIRKRTKGTNSYFFIEKRGLFRWNQVYRYNRYMNYECDYLRFDSVEEAELYIYNHLIPDKVETVKEIKYDV